MTPASSRARSGADADRVQPDETARPWVRFSVAHELAHAFFLITREAIFAIGPIRSLFESNMAARVALQRCRSQNADALHWQLHRPGVRSRVENRTAHGSPEEILRSTETLFGATSLDGPTECGYCHFPCRREPNEFVISRLTTLTVPHWAPHARPGRALTRTCPV